MKAIKVRNKNVILELLKAGANFEKIAILKGLEEDELTKEILFEATNRNVVVSRAVHQKMPRRRESESREVLVGFLIPNNYWMLESLLKDLRKKGQDPFFLFLNRVKYENNIGVIARTAFAAGVNGIFFQTKKERFFNEETFHFSMGTISRIPLVKMSIFNALKELKKNNIKTFSLQMGGNTYFKEDLSGPVAFVLGAERRGASDVLSDKCDKKLSIPMCKGLDSMNVGISAGVILYEKVRQEGGIFSS